MTESDKITAEEWYTVEEIRRWLTGTKPDIVPHAEFITCHLRHAFRKGQQLSPELAELREENEQLKYHNAALLDMNATDWQKLVEWLKNPERKPSMVAFTAGIARHAAAAVEQSGILKANAPLGVETKSTVL